MPGQLPSLRPAKVHVSALRCGPMNRVLLLALALGLVAALPIAAPAIALQQGDCEEGERGGECPIVCRDENGRVYLCSDPDS